MITRADRVKDAIRYFSLVTVILGLLLFFSWVGIHSNIYKYIQALKQQDAIDSGVIVEAEYVGTFQGGKSGDTKRMKYVYYDEINDVYYEGRGEL